jgi:hypothetical protein
MKNRNIFLAAAMAALCLAGCVKVYSQYLANTAWKLVEVRNGKASESLTYPAKEFPYIVEFRGSEMVYFPRHCNYSHGKYEADEEGKISFAEFGDGTEMYCTGISEWEYQMVQNLPNATEYKIYSDRLSIFCGATQLIFERIVQQDNLLANSEWQIEQGFLGRDEDVREYSLSAKREYDPLSSTLYPWGYFVRFFSDGTFYSFDTQPCGNSCFTKVYGRYFLPQDNKLTIFVDSVNRDCTWANGTNETEIRHGRGISFEILDFSREGFLLRRE